MIISIHIPTNLQELDPAPAIIDWLLYDMPIDSIDNIVKLNLIVGIKKFSLNHVMVDSDYTLLFKLNMDLESFDDLVRLIKQFDHSRISTCRLMKYELENGLTFVQNLEKMLLLKDEEIKIYNK
jgi:hypothetical protein